jgi:hypothetical protein
MDLNPIHHALTYLRDDGRTTIVDVTRNWYHLRRVQETLHPYLTTKKPVYNRQFPSGLFTEFYELQKSLTGSAKTDPSACLMATITLARTARTIEPRSIGLLSKIIDLQT